MGLRLPRRASVLTDGSPMSATLSGRCWNPTAWCAACRDGLKQSETIGRDRIGSQGRVVSVSHRDPGAGVALSDCPGSASGRALRPSPHRLTPSSPRGGRSVKPLIHKRCLSFCELAAQEMEAHASCARANVTRPSAHARTHARTHAHTHTRTRITCAPARIRAHARTRTRTHARARLVIQTVCRNVTNSGRNRARNPAFFLNRELV